MNDDLTTSRFEEVTDISGSSHVVTLSEKILQYRISRFKIHDLTYWPFLFRMIQCENSRIETSTAWKDYEK